MSGYYSPWYGIEEFLILLIPFVVVFFIYRYVSLQGRNQNIKEANFYQKQLGILKSKEFSPEEKSAAIYSFRFLKKYRKYFKKNSKYIKKIISNEEHLVQEFDTFLEKSTHFSWIRFALWSIFAFGITVLVIPHVVLWLYY